MSLYEKAYKHLTLRNTLLVCFAISMFSMLLNVVAGATAASWFSAIPITISLGFMIFFVYALRVAKPLLWSEFVEGIRMDIYKWASLIHPDVDSFQFRSNYMTWRMKGSTRICGAKVFAVVEIPYTYKDMTSQEYDGRSRTYAVTMTSGNVRIATLHMRLPIDKETFISALRRQRDIYQMSFDTGGTPSHLDEARKRDALLKRIEERMEEPYDARFFIVVAAEADTEDELKSILESHSESVENRFSNDIGVVVAELKHFEMMEAIRFFRPQALLDDSFATSSKLKPQRAVSMDLAFQNPLVARRLPPLEKLLFGIFIGVTREGETPISWTPLFLPCYHVIVLGPVGVGKTTFARTVLYRGYVIMGVPFWVVDPAGEYGGFVEKMGGVVVDFKNETINPFVLYDRDPMSTATTITEMMTYMSGLTGAERFFLRRTILDVYSIFHVDLARSETWSDEASNEVTFEVIYNYISARLESYPPDDAILAKGVINKIEQVSIGKYKIGKGTFSLDKLYNRRIPVCFDVRKPLPEYLQRAVVWTLMKQLYTLAYSRYKIAEDLQLLLLVDEAHLFSNPVQAQGVPGGVIEPPLSEFVRMMRKRGVGCWLLSHSPSDLPPVLYEVVGTLFLFGSTGRDYMDWCRDHLYLNPEDVKQMLWMGRGEGVIRFYGDPRSIAVKVIAEPETVTNPPEEASPTAGGETESLLEWFKRKSQP